MKTPYKTVVTATSERYLANNETNTRFYVEITFRTTKTPPDFVSLSSAKFLFRIPLNPSEQKEKHP